MVAFDKGTWAPGLPLSRMDFLWENGSASIWHCYSTTTIMLLSRLNRRYSTYTIAVIIGRRT